MAGTANRPSLPDPDQITGKGTTLKAALAFVESQPGPPPMERLLRELDPTTRALLSGMIIPSSRYPLRQLVAVYEGIDRAFGRGDLARCWDIGKFSADYEVKLLHKVFLQVAKLDYWMRIAGSTWRHYYSAGTMTAAMGATEGTIHLRDFHPVSKAFCYRFGGWVHRICELSRLDQVKVRHTACVLDGAESCRWDGSWRKA